MPDTPHSVADMLSVAGIPPDRYADLMPRVDASQVRVRVASSLFLRLWAKGISAVTTPWGVFVHPDAMGKYLRGDDLDWIGRLMVHELMHVEQLARLGVLAHSIQYATDYIRGRASGHQHWDAYRAVRLEKEARAASRVVAERAQ